MTIQVKLADRTAEQVREMPLIEIAYELLSETREPLYYRDLMAKVANLLNMTQAENDAVIAHLYTDVNIDGRFLCIGENVWGLKSWYPVEKSAERTSSRRFVRKEVAGIDDDDDDLDVEDIELEELELEEEAPFVLPDDDVLEDDEELADDELEFLDGEEDLSDDDDDTEVL
ncbi:MAG: DNA-directed RNA polymerase subunit delta [Acidibacillus sp.]|uniref:Probable DNA-directed RNA polymerase subunit delta n=1 Tax=Sulfoacidibacillus ferrooxidans TaxID=2005001 RepID=A0A9X2ADE9_9BACL|nr:DNA-directed RNA polymerase subunit delta [Sulfoacidibacillus ferrooxidans]MCY0893982.1 DNA-directed RNA polymerase subunit delta [Acidibacillus sp.]